MLPLQRKVWPQSSRHTSHHTAARLAQQTANLPAQQQWEGQRMTAQQSSATIPAKNA
jgi:hypothetical protein